MDDRIVPEHASARGLAIVERYMQFVNYMYPMAINWSGRNHVFRDMFIQTALTQPRLFYEAAKSNQISRLYIADAGLATLREYLRFARHQPRHLRMINKRQHEVAESHLGETGSMLGKWIEKKKR